MITGLIILYFFYRIFLCKNKEIDSGVPAYPWEVPFNSSVPKVPKSASGAGLKGVLYIAITFVVLSVAAVTGVIIRLFKNVFVKH
jgi:hypothetical protein